VADETERRGRLQRAEKAREDQWARSRDEEILKRLREKYAKHINCPVYGTQLDPRAAIGLGGMACPKRDGAWLNAGTLEKVRARLRDAAAVHHEAIGEKVFAAIDEIVKGLLERHPQGLDCPECGARLDPQGRRRIGRTAVPQSPRRMAGARHDCSDRTPPR
jgi:hypothetical protein